MNSDDKGHEILIGGIDEMKGQVMDKHMLPFQRFYELEQTLYDHDVQILTLACYDYLLL